MGEIELRQPGYVAELVEIFNKAKKGGSSTGATTSSGFGPLSISSTTSVPSTTGEVHHSRTIESLSEITSSFSHDLPVLYSDYLQPSTSLQWSPEGNSDSAEHYSIDAFSSLRPKTKCVCVCNEKSCEFINRPYSIGSGRSSPAGADIPNKSLHLRKVFTLLKEKKNFHNSYDLTRSKPQSRWWKRRKTLDNCRDGLESPLTPTPGTTSIASAIDVVDCGTNTLLKSRTNGVNGSIPEIIEMSTMQRNDASAQTINVSSDTNGDVPHDESQDRLDQENLVDSENKHSLSSKFKLPELLTKCRNCIYKPSPIRIVLLVIGTFLFLIGISYDFGMKHGVNYAFKDTWSNLMEEYLSFGNNFLSYNLLSVSPESSKLKSPKYARFTTDRRKSYWEGVSEVDPNFMYYLEGLEVSLQVHFFDLEELQGSDDISVKDIGPLYLKVTFNRQEGFRLDYDKKKSNMTLSTKFIMYDVMRMLMESNEQPHFGFQMNDYYATTPAAVLDNVINIFKKIDMNSAVLEKLQAQARRRRRSGDDDLYNVIRWNSVEEMIRNSFLTLPIDRSETVNIPVPLLKKNSTFEYSHDSFDSKIPSLKYDYQKTIQKYIKSKYFGSRNDRNHYLKQYSEHKSLEQYNNDGPLSLVTDIEPALREVLKDIRFFGQGISKFPCWVSSPHFLSHTLEGKNKKISRNNYGPIRGFSPSKLKHGSFLSYHPQLGVPMNASIAVQLGIRPPSKMQFGEKLVPIVWFRAQIERIPSSLWYLFWFFTHLRIFLITFLCCTGVLLISLAVVCRCHQQEPPPVMV